MSKGKRSTVDIFKDLLNQEWVPEPTMPVEKRNQQVDISQYLLTHSFKGPKTIGSTLASRQGAESEKPSVLSSIFETMSGPLYGALHQVEETAGDAMNLVGLDNKHTKREGFGKDLLDLLSAPSKSIAGGLAQSAVAASNLPGVSPLPKLLAKSEGVKDFANKNAPKQYSSDILANDFGVKNKALKYGGGFVLDTLADPLTYVPGADILSIGKRARAAKLAAQGLDAQAPKIAENATEALTSKAAGTPTAFIKSRQVAPELNIPVAESLLGGKVPALGQQFSVPRQKVPGAFINPIIPVERKIATAGPKILEDPEQLAAMEATKRVDDAKRANNVRWNRPLDWHDMADATPESNAAFADMFRQGKMAKAGKVSDGKGNFSTGAVTHVLQAIENGEIPRFGPIPKAAEGTYADVAKTVTDKFVQNLGKGAAKPELNPANQANLYNRMFSATADLLKPKKLKKAEKAGLTPEQIAQITGERNLTIKERQVLARQMLRTAENHLISQGVHPVFWNGMRVRLSDVLEEVGADATDELPTRVMAAFMDKNPNKVSDPLVRQAVNKALARRSLSVSDLLQNLSQHTLDNKKSLLQGYNYPKAQKILNNMPKAAEESVRPMGLTEEEVKAVGDHVRNLINIDNTPIEDVINKIGPGAVKSILEGRADAKAISAMNKAIVKQIGMTPEKLMNDITGNRVVDGTMTRTSTWFGRQKEMKQYSADVFNWKEQNAYYRAEWLRNMVRTSTPDNILKAFRAAQMPELRAGEAHEVLAIAYKFTDYFDNMLGSSGFKDLADYEGTTAVKSQLVMKDVNKHLAAVGSKFQFMDSAKAKNLVGVPRDYSKNGDGWMRFWENADPRKSGQDPISFMYDFDLALERTIAEYALYDEFAMRFGARKTDAHFNPAIHKEPVEHTRLSGYLFHPDVQKEFRRIIKDNETGIWKPSSPAMRFYSRALRVWKTLVTIYFPSHHIRNLIGDTYLMWAAGHNDPRAFIWSQRILSSQRAKYAKALKSPDITSLQGLIDKDAMKWASTEGKDVILRQGNTSLTAEQIYIAAHQHGLLLSANKLEDIFGEAPFGGLAKNATLRRLQEPFGGRAHHAATQLAEYREHYIRLAHFTAAINKGLKKSNDLDKVFSQASAEVRKWHPDGRDLSQFEQKLRYVIPFYSWTRKSIPLLIQTAVTRPSKVMYYPRATRAIQGMMGIETDPGIADPFPNDQLFPDWIRSNAIGPIGDPQSDNAVSAFWGKLGKNSIDMYGNQEGYTIVNPSNPFQDTVAQYGGMGNSQDLILGVAEGLTPGLRVPGELIFGQKTTGQPIYAKDGGNFATYAAEQVPQLGALNRVLDLGKPKRDNVEQGIDTEAIINMMTALGVRGTGPYQKTAEFEARDRARAK